MGVIFLLTEDSDQSVHAYASLGQLTVHLVTAAQVSGEVGQDLCRLVSLVTLLVLKKLYIENKIDLNSNRSSHHLVQIVDHRDLEAQEDRDCAGVC